jgi:hypothetical protein
MDGSSGLKGDATLFTEILISESRSVDPETIEDRKNYQLLQQIEGYDLCDI